MTRRSFLSGAAAGLAWSCGESESAATQEREVLQVVAYYSPSTSGLYLAREHDYFGEYGLQVEIEPMLSQGTIQALPALATRRADIGFWTLSPSFVGAVARDAAVRIVMGREVISHNCPVIGNIIGLRSSFPNGLDDLSVLRGKAVSLPAEASFNAFMVEEVLARFDLTRADFKPAPLGREALPALRAGKIDAFFGSDLRFTERELQDKFISTRTVTDAALGVPVNFTYFGGTLLERPVENNPGARFLAAFHRGLADFQNGQVPVEIYDYMQARGVQLDRTDGICRDAFAPEGGVDLERLDRFAQWCFEKEYCDRRVSAEELVDLRFLEESFSILGEAA